MLIKAKEIYTYTCMEREIEVHIRLKNMYNINRGTSAYLRIRITRGLTVYAITNKYKCFKEVSTSKYFTQHIQRYSYFLDDDDEIQCYEIQLRIITQNNRESQKSRKSEITAEKSVALHCLALFGPKFRL